MGNSNKIKTANILSGIARYTLLVISIVVISFALISGSEDYGGGIQGVLKNSPNAIPWVSLLILVFIAWKWQLVGGILVTTLGLFLFYFFNFNSPNFFISTFILTLVIPILGFLFLLSWYLKRDNQSYP